MEGFKDWALFSFLILFGFVIPPGRLSPLHQQSDTRPGRNLNGAGGLIFTVYRFNSELSAPLRSCDRRASHCGCSIKRRLPQDDKRKEFPNPQILQSCESWFRQFNTLHRMLMLFYVSLGLLLVYGVLIDYYKRSWKGIPLYSSSDQAGGIWVTVVVPARNEEGNIGKCLDALLAQAYPSEWMNIIVVNDHSTDRTAEVVLAYQTHHLRLVNLADYVDTPINSYKKKAIEVAVSLAGGGLVVTTDADCTAGPGWISTLVACYQATDARFMAAPVKIEAGRSLLSIFQALDFMTLQGITGAAVYKKFHSMCNGANLAYSKAAFYEVGGYQGIDQIASGDDMLLMHKIFSAYPDHVFFIKDQAAIVTTKAAPTWKAFFQQRIRWASKADKYNDKRILPVLLLVYFLNLFCFCFLIAGLWNPALVAVLPDPACCKNRL